MDDPQVLTPQEKAGRTRQQKAAATKRLNKLLQAGNEQGHRVQGVFAIPDRQNKLDQGARGQFMHCPSCGEECLIPMDLRLECVCKGLFTVTLGVSEDNNVTVVRVDRWR